MKPPSLGRGLSFALLAALASLPFQLTFAPLLGYDRSFASYALALTIAALLYLAPSLRRGALAAALAALVLVPIALTAPGPFAALLAGLCLLGIGRSGILYPRPFARALALELGLALASTLVASLLYDGRLFGGALSVWCFWLVQSVFGLVSGTTKTQEAERGDAFERAHAAADRLMRARAGS